MSFERSDFIVSPIVVPADETSTVSITSPSLRWVQDSDAEAVLTRRRRERSQGVETLEFSKCPDGIVFDAAFDGEQEHVLRLERVRRKETQLVGEFHVYSVHRDLLRLRPFKGDFHLHSNRSDGKDLPARVAVRCREIGMDFMAITDHGQYEPSLEAKSAFASVACDMKIYPGEEVHPPDNPVHMINFGGARSVNAAFADGARYDAELTRFRQTMGPIPSDVNPSLWVSTLWSLQQIREAGGLAVFCHPYWVLNGSYPVDGALTDRLLAEKPFDALEVIGGYTLAEAESNALQAARYADERAKGNEFPIVGLSDSHGCDTGSLFGWYYTVVFAENDELGTLISAIKEYRSVAVEHVEKQRPHVYGRFRLVKFTHFLLREYFPRHDRLCAKEGIAMRRHMSGQAGGGAELATLQGQCERFHREAFACAGPSH